MDAAKRCQWTLSVMCDERDPSVRAAKAIRAGASCASTGRRQSLHDDVVAARHDRPGQAATGVALAPCLVPAYRYRHRRSGALHELDIALQVLPVGLVVDAGLREWHRVRAKLS